ncbi:hypothetical protein BA187_16705 [Serratia marcescens]|nr:hypothetical protein BA187_16705 [Serratia marcescens]
MVKYGLGSISTLIMWLISIKPGSIVMQSMDEWPVNQMLRKLCVLMFWLFFMRYWLKSAHIIR